MERIEPRRHRSRGSLRAQSRLARLALAIARWSERVAVACSGGTSRAAPRVEPNPVSPRRQLSHDEGPPHAPPDTAGILTLWRCADRELRELGPSDVADRAYTTLALDVAAPYLGAYRTLPALLEHYLADRCPAPTLDTTGRAERPTPGTVEYWVAVACQAFPVGATRRQRQRVEHAAFWRRLQQVLNEHVAHLPGLDASIGVTTPQLAAGARFAHDGGNR